ncbi:uncharacterized protein BDCG_02470 [Blastomyces dermatitidis ER-3]|uniref:Ubiquitin conjugating enzyme n=1 Tax=Ajellomyces dermatitidis (strain ER-3 / ATCC MYA-2586) TaxID=559297 RepID=A0ABP2ETX9_AJEDR|nr:uncharacterized protein BDCG_02470 [Blastomyces dermatitidis ER-3]EEQ87350.1 hypothetical protein BDCG_02470 [Blastomyces dermatitidis ER-3]EQL38367.1 hypothetical protein BDFG_00719 [Blastomyces dermatitidis ATCC 26199]
MSAVAHHLVRRGMDATSGYLSPTSNDDNEERRKLSVWAILVFSVTAIVFGLISFAIQYTYGTVVATLAVVEDPHPDIYERIRDSPDDSSKTTNAVRPGPDVALERLFPVTSTLRSAILHLRARAGPWSRFRGLGIYMCLVISRSILSQFFTFGRGNDLSHPLHSFGRIAAEVVSAPLALAWVHIVISEPSAKRFWRRIPGYSSWVKIAPAVALQSVASQLTFILPAHLAMRSRVWSVNEGNPLSDPEFDLRAEVAIAIGSFLLAICLTLLIELPATVTMIRVAASILPDQEETIVPFDRTFGGKVQPAILGGSGKIGLLDAWKTFTWPSRVRLLKVLVKTFAMMVPVTVACAIVIAGEASLMKEKMFVQA